MPYLIWYFILFVPQLAFGAAVGWWFSQRNGGTTGAGKSAPEIEGLTAEEVRVALGRLKLLTDSVQDDVREHAEKVGSSNKELADVKPGDADSAMAAIAPIIQANEDLQLRLHETEKKLAEQAEELDQQVAEARTDPLTGLLNRRGMETHMPKLFEDYEQSQQNFCLTILDIDYFKKFNDEYGHDVGDMVLCEVARVVSGAVRRDDIVARFGGEEFVIISPDTDLHEAGLLLERVRTAVEENIVHDEAGDLKVTISLGLAQISSSESAGTEEEAALMKRADTAMYAAKDNGRNRTYFHDGEKTHPVVLDEAANDVDRAADLPDATAFNQELARRIAESARCQSDISLVVLEIDNLSTVEDEHGSNTANLVRSDVAAFITNTMREMDLAGQGDQDGFSILLPVCSLDDASRVAERVRASASQTPFEFGDVSIQITLSAGVTIVGPGESAEFVMERCQRALGTSIEAGGDRSTIEEPPTDTETDDSADAAEPQEVAEPALA